MSLLDILSPPTDPAQDSPTMHRRDDDTSNFVDLHVEGRARLGHLRGLDGLRGLAVAAVVAFHAGFDRMVGGYLGVSTFFTLSGFLITSLLLAGSTREHGVHLQGFWGRRFRRLFPASVVTLLLVVALFAPFVATADQLASMRGDVLASLADVANWRFILQGQSYADLFAAPSPVLHFWSLAIEEQFYIVFPLILWAAVRLVGGRRVRLGLALGGLAAASLAWTLWGGLPDNQIYFGTLTRAAELLLGAVLAIVLTKRSVRQRLALRFRWRTAAVTLGAMALALQAWWWWTLPQSTSWLYRGGFVVYALLTCTVIVAAAIPGGPVFRLCTLTPLRWLGARSYAIYLLHWPLMLTFRQLLPDLDRWVSTLLAVGLALVLAEISFHVLERPIRTGGRLAARRAPLAAFGSSLLVVALLFLLVPADPPGQTRNFDTDLVNYRRFVASHGSTTTTTAAPTFGVVPATTVPVPPVPRVAIYGDSTTLAFGMGLGAWSVGSGRLGMALGDLRFGCPVPLFAQYKADDTVTPDADCRAWPQRWQGFIDQSTPDVAVLDSSVWSVPDVRLPGHSTFSAVGDPEVDAFVVQEYLKAVDILSSRGALVLLCTWPPYGTWADDGRADAVKRQTDPARMARYDELMYEVAKQRPGRAGVLDLSQWLGDRSQDRTLRPDGTHFDPGQFEQLSAEWVGPEIERLWQEHWRQGQAAPAGAGTPAAPVEAPAPRAPAATESGG